MDRLRAYDTKFLEQIANDELVRWMYGGEGYLDLSPLNSRPGVFIFQMEDGGFILDPVPDQPNVYEVHTIFKPGANPVKCARFARMVQDELFTNLGCLELVTRVPSNNRAADRLAKFMCFVEIATEECLWKPGVTLSTRSLTLDRWRSLCSTAGEAGKAFQGSDKPPAIPASEGLSCQ